MVFVFVSYFVQYSEAIWFEAAGKPIELSRVVKRRYNEFAELDHCLRVGKHSRSLKGLCIRQAGRHSDRQADTEYKLLWQIDLYGFYV
jgi:hypothetical protein